MPDYAVQDIIAGISNIPESAYNSLVIASASFLGIRTRGRGFPVPDQEKFDDRGVIGNQSEQPTQQRSGFIIPPTMEITDTLSTELPAVYGRRSFGGADAVTVLEAGVAWEHVIPMLGNYTAAGRQLPSSSIAYSIGGADFLYGGCCFDTFRIDAAGVADPTFTTGIAGSGLYKKISTISPALVIPRPTAQNYVLGADSQLLFTDAGGTLTLTNAPQRLINFSCTLNNALDTGKRRVGDPHLVADDFNLGWYTNRMLHGDDRGVTAEMVVALDQNMREWSDAHNNTIITSFRWRSRGTFIGASTTNRFTYEVQFDKCYFRSTRGNDANGDATLAIGIFPVEDGITFGTTKLRIINGSAAAIL